MRLLVLSIATAATWMIANTSADARCSQPTRYPGTVGALTYLLATATADTVRALPRSEPGLAAPSVVAQVMKVDDVAGFTSARIARGLRASGGTAVFVRYSVGTHCGPVPAPHGLLDSVGVNGLFVGVPRSENDWIAGRPTFDIYNAGQYPLSRRHSAPGGQLVVASRTDSLTMTAPELFTMYRALWSDSVFAQDSTVQRRLLRWSATNREAALKHPAQEVADGMLRAVAEARVVAFPVPDGGTFDISVVVPALDSMAVSGRIDQLAHVWRGDTERDSISGLPITFAKHTFAIYLELTADPTVVAESARRILPCWQIVPIIVDSLPIVPSADSTWQGKMWPMGFLECAPAGSRLKELSQTTRGHNSEAALVTFRRHADGRVSFEGRARGPGERDIYVRGERTSTASGPPN